jgi:putative peptidoglycan lipid II flippase
VERGQFRRTPAVKEVTPATGATTTPSSGRAAFLVSAITLVGRAVGLVRTLVLTSILGITYLGNTYASANAVPNLLYEIIAGGVLAASLLPAIAGPASEADHSTVERTASAVLNRALLIMTPVVLIGMAFRKPVVSLLTSGVADPAVRAMEQRLAAFLLLMFLPQIWLYVVGVVMTAVLHAYHRFTAPALAPLLSSVVVTATYLVYGLIEGPNADNLESVSRTGQLVLGLGTTLGVAVLSLSLVFPAQRLGWGWRPVLRVPHRARKRIGSLVVPALVTVLAQQAFLAVVLVVANRVEGGVVAYQLAFTLLLVFWAVFPLPMATTTFPGLAAVAVRSDSEFARRCAEAGRRVVLIVLGAAALMISVADAGASLVLALGAGGGARSKTMVAWTVAAFALGLVGYGLHAYYTRAAYALGDGQSPSVAAFAGFGLATVLAVIAPGLYEGAELIAALAGAFSIGIMAGALLLLAMFRRKAGRASLEGVGTAAGRGLGAAVAAGFTGAALAAWIPGGSLLQELLRTAVATLAAVTVYVLVQALLGERELTGVLTRARLTRHPAASEDPP